MLYNDAPTLLELFPQYDLIPPLFVFEMGYETNAEKKAIVFPLTYLFRFFPTT